ncbi:MAG TPA: DUF192 domain-containing protein [Steroidobacter sp.]|uniref:DUF192 domain-containing protein n=1 Tax=Steroidobacter sp. TaxID=1978227 RepID=UPI002EDAB30F
MKTLELHTADGRCIARHVYMACSFRSRCLGLLNRADIPEEEGLLLVPGGSIHTIGMRFNIDVVFLNRQMRVLELVEQVPPWRVVIAPRGTRRVLELAGGKIAATRLTVGTYLMVEALTTNAGERPKACQRSPIQFSLRLPVDRRCTGSIQPQCSARARILRSPPPYLRALDAHAETRPSVGN